MKQIHSAKLKYSCELLTIYWIRDSKFLYFRFLCLTKLILGFLHIPLPCLMEMVASLCKLDGLRAAPRFIEAQECRHHYLHLLLRD